MLSLVGRECLKTLPTIDTKETCGDNVDADIKLAAELRIQGCELIIALTHMRTPNDINLAENCQDIHLNLGDHDHIYEIKEFDGVNIIKSGTDFKQFSKITLIPKRNDKGKITENVEAVDFTSEFPEDIELKDELETNLGDWVCDVVLDASGADIVIINSGIFRSDQVHPAGPFTMRDLMNIILHPLVLIEITGRCPHESSENAISIYPKLSRRFSQVSGATFAYLSKPTGHRLIKAGDE
uniref:5'-Nucleotidase C-terminal domain-containing protein n=1 Tax=Glossina palpalis gambiensis TaxID=67801 RepID=A0A1B0C2X8_9MUSC